MQLLSRLLSFAVWVVLLAVVHASAAERPNILFIISDDHGYQAVSAYGAGLNKTPNIDRIAKEGCAVHRLLRPAELHRRPERLHHGTVSLTQGDR